MAANNRLTPDDFHEPKTGAGHHTAPAKSAAARVLSAVTAGGNTLLSLLSGLLAAAMILYSGLVLYDTFYTQNAAYSSGLDLLQYKPEIIENGATPLSGAETLAKVNAEYRAWLTLYGTNIDYPVMQHDDDLYYASHDVYGNTSLTGAIYLAARNAPDLSDSYNLIYGHHMDNGAMFGALDRYTEAEYLAGYGEGMLVGSGGVYDLRVFAVAETDAYESRIYTVGDRMDEVLAFLEEPGEKTTVLSFDRAAAEGAEKIAALSTCAAANTNGRLVVFAKMTLRPMIEVEAVGFTGVYSGGPYTLASVTPSVDPEGTTYEYSVDGGATWSSDMPGRVDAGVTEVMVKAKNPYYGEATATAAITVLPFPVTVTALDAQKVYNTGDPAFFAAVTPTEPGAALPADNMPFLYEVTRANADEAAGEYARVLQPRLLEQPGLENYRVTYVPADFRITPASAELLRAGLRPVNYEGLYDARVHEAYAESEIPGTTIEYFLNGAWTAERPTIRDVLRAGLDIGTATVPVRAANPNYEMAESAVTLTVRPFPVTVRALDEGKAYGEEDPDFRYELTAARPDGTPFAVTVTRANAGEENLGTYEDVLVPALADAEGLGNYAVTLLPGSFTIRPAAQLPLTLHSYDDIYDGRTHEAYAESEVPGTTIEYFLDGAWTAERPTIRDVLRAGNGELDSLTVPVRATNPNYETAEGSVTLTVRPFPVAVRALDSGKAYGEEDPDFRFELTAGRPDDTPFAVTVTRANAGENSAGAYPDVLMPALADAEGLANYEITYDPGSFTIRPGTLTLTAQGFDGIYDALYHPVTAAVSDAAGTAIAYSTDGGRTWSAEAPALRDVLRDGNGELDSLTVLVRAENPNYETAEVRTVLRVRPRALTVAANAASKAAGEEDPVFTASVTGEKPDDGFDLVYTVSRPGAGADEKAGVYPGAIVPAGEAVQGSYVITYLPASFLIVDNPGGAGGNPNAPDGNPGAPDGTPPDQPGGEGEDIDDFRTPLASFINRFNPTIGPATPAWALVNLICLVLTVYLLFPLLHLRDKYGRARLMRKVNAAKEELREAEELFDREQREKLRIERQAALDKARAAGVDGEAAVRASEAVGFGDITEAEFSTAVESLYYRVRKFLRRFRTGIGLEVIDAALALVVFLLTEDMRLPMVLIDKWTPLMILFLAFCWVTDVRLARYREKVLADEEEQETAAAAAG